MNASTLQTFSPTPAPHRVLHGRILHMKAVWTALGALSGASVGMEYGGLIGAIALMLACVVEFATLGVIFALLGGRAEDTILGAIGGLLGGLAAGMMGGQASAMLLANTGMLVGAVVGSTLHVTLRLLALSRGALNRFPHRRQQLAADAVGADGLNEHQPFLPASSSPYAGNHPVAARSSLRHDPVVFAQAPGLPANA